MPSPSFSRLLITLTALALVLVACTAPPAGAPAVSEVTATSRTSVRVTFDRAIHASTSQNNFSIRAPDGATLAILAAYIDGAVAHLATEPQSETTYELDANAVAPIDGAATASLSRASFQGSPTGGPVVASAVPLSNTEVLLTFVDPDNGTGEVMDQTADDDLRYFLTSDPALAIEAAALSVDRTQILLTTSSQEAVPYTITVTNIRARSSDALVDPANASATFIGFPIDDDTPPTIEEATSLSPTEVLVTFSEPVRTAAGDPSRYAIEASPAGPSLQVVAVALNEFRTQATLTTLEQDDVPYTLAASGLRDRMGNRQPTTTIDFDGQAPEVIDSVPPILQGAVSTGPNSVLIAFSEPVGEGATEPDHYAIRTRGGALTTQSLLQVTAATLGPDARSVTLTTLDQSEIEYTLAVVNVRDLAGNPIAPPNLSRPFQTTFLGSGTVGAPIDSDGDGLSDAAEQRGWTVTVHYADGSIRSYEVTSDPNVADTDGDDLGDMDERGFGTDPRNIDTDGDDLTDFPGDMTDYRELTDIYSDPTNQDTDGDGLEDGLEFSFFRTSPTLEDTDGDQILDADEVNLGNRNARLADLPLLGIEIDTVDLALDVRFSATSTTGTRELETVTVESTLSTSENQSFSNTDTNTDEFYANAGTEQGWNQEGTLGYSASYSVEAGYSGAWESQFTEESGFETQEAFGESQTTEEETTTEESVTREVEGASMRVAVYIRNLGNIAFSLENLELTVLRYDLGQGALVPVASLVPAQDAVYNLGLQIRERGPIVFESDQIFPSVIEQLMANPTSLSFKVANYDITDEEGRNFAYTSQDVNDRTATLIIDFGGFDEDGDGIGEDAERYRVATSAGRPLEDTDGSGTIDGDDRRVLYDGDGDQLGITLREALERVLGLVHYDEDTTPSATLDEFALETSYSTRIEDGVETLFRVRAAINNPAGRQQWDIITPTGIDRSIDFDDRVLLTEDGLTLALARDTDGDLLTARQEFGFGASDNDLDSDNDGLDDRFEVAERWTVDAGRGFVEVYPNPGRADTDRDGLSDWEEFNSCIAVRDADGRPILDATEVVDVGINLGVELAVPTCFFLFSKIDGTPIDGPTAPDDSDSDDDGVSDADEVLGYVIELRAGGTIEVLTDPLNPDSDGDGTSDGREAELGGNPTDPNDGDDFLDDDGDGLTNSEESDGWTVTYENVSTTTFSPGTSTSPGTVSSDPGLADTDGDNLTDFWERELGTDPTVADTDGDGLTDFEEAEQVLVDGEPVFVALYDPTDADIDDDKRSDGDEVNTTCSVGPVEGITTQVSSDPFVADVDGDGLGDGDECGTYNTDPTDANTDGDDVTDGNEIAIGTDPLVEDKLVRVTLTTITVNFDCDSGDNGGDFEGVIRIDGPLTSDLDWVDFDIIDGVGHDTEAGVEEGDTVNVDAVFEEALTDGDSIRFFASGLTEVTGDDAEFDDNAIVLDETIEFGFISTGPDSIELDDGNNCKLTIAWRIDLITSP